MAPHTERTLLGATVLAVLFCQCSCYLMGEEPSVMQQSPDRLAHIRAVYDDNSLSDKEQINTLVGFLDDSISAWKAAKHERPAATAGGKNKAAGSKAGNAEPSAQMHARDCALLVRLIAERPYPTSQTGRSKAIAEAQKSLTDRKNIRELQLYLNVSLAFAGGSASNRELLEVLRDSETPEDIVAVALQAFDRSRVPIELLPDLVRLTGHPWWTVADTEGVGHPPVPRRVYPIRENALVCLRRLGIDCKRVLVEDPVSDPEWRTHRITTIKIDRPSMLKTIKSWLLDEHEKVWQPAVAVVKEMNQEDVWKVVEGLRAENKLSQRKLVYMEKAFSRGKLKGDRNAL